MRHQAMDKLIAGSGYAINDDNELPTKDANINDVFTQFILK